MDGLEKLLFARRHRLSTLPRGSGKCSI